MGVEAGNAEVDAKGSDKKTNDSSAGKTVQKLFGQSTDCHFCSSGLSHSARFLNSYTIKKFKTQSLCVVHRLNGSRRLGWRRAGGT